MWCGGAWQDGGGGAEAQWVVGQARGAARWPGGDRAGHIMAADADVASMGLALQHFSWPDYLVFVAMLALCAVIGVYFGYLAPGQRDEDEYLMGGRQMKTLPISLSLVASYISGITLIGMPTEVYIYGIQFLYGIIGMALCLTFFAWAILPVFHELQVMTLYQGGMKAVVWTDVVQTVSMMSCILLVAIKGTMDVGGFGVVMEHGLQSGRIEQPVMQADPFLRHTAWACAMGSFFHGLVSCGMSQSMTQRYLALPTLAKARRSVFYFLVGCWMLMIVCCYCGLLIHATYHDCDPVTTKARRSLGICPPSLNLSGFCYRLSFTASACQGPGVAAPRHGHLGDVPGPAGALRGRGVQRRTQLALDGAQLDGRSRGRGLLAPLGLGAAERGGRAHRDARRGRCVRRAVRRPRVRRGAPRRRAAAQRQPQLHQLRPRTRRLRGRRLPALGQRHGLPGGRGSGPVFHGVDGARRPARHRPRPALLPRAAPVRGQLQLRVQRHGRERPAARRPRVSHPAPLPWPVQTLTSTPLSLSLSPQAADGSVPGLLPAVPVPGDVRVAGRLAARLSALQAVVAARPGPASLLAAGAWPREARRRRPREDVQR
ncbi:hypothetical protein FOCC_FOCC005263 [Frankliniella occidentalis]|nr:hypothetical protein FOCC_FOCC005263 [Frankliniella occidentalis]